MLPILVSVNSNGTRQNWSEMLSGIGKKRLKKIAVVKVLNKALTENWLDHCERRRNNNDKDNKNSKLWMPASA